MTLHRHATLISTNDEARRLADSGAPHGTVVQALQQTGGRGRRGRTWISPPGNLYASFVLRLVCPAIRHGEIGFVMALAVADAVDAAAGHGCARLKWPNDVLLGGAKVAGVLVETSGSAIAGVGINIAHAPADQLALCDGWETVDAEWIAPAEALRLGEIGERTVIFPTRMNLQLLAEATSAADAIARATARPLVTVMPQVVERDGERCLIIPEDAGYGAVVEPFDRAMR